MSKNPVFSNTPTYETPAYSQEYRTDVLSAEDWLGNRFAVGDEVIYCIGAGRGQLMAIGKVLKIRARKWDRTRYDGVIIPCEDVNVQVLTEKTSGTWDAGKRTRPAWVNPLNITALPVILVGQLSD